MSRSAAALLSFFLIAAADGAPLQHAWGAPDGPGPRCGGGFVAARGDTLYSIARRCGTSVAELARANDLGHPPRLAAGQRLAMGGALPARPRRERAMFALRPLPVREREPVAYRGQAPRHDRLVYRIAAGDTLYSLARWARVSLPSLLAANPGVDSRRIELGDEIALPPGAQPPGIARERERGGARAASDRSPPRTVAPRPPRPPRPPRAPPPRMTPPPSPALDDGKPAEDGSDDDMADEPDIAGM